MARHVSAGSEKRQTPEQLNVHPGDVMVEDIAAVLAAPELRQFGSLPLIFYGHSAGGGIAAAGAVEIAEAAAAGQDSRTVAGVLLEDPFWRLPVTRLQDPEVAAAACAALTSAQGARVEVFQDASHFIRRDATHRFMNTASAFFEDCGRAVPHRVS